MSPLDKHFVDLGDGVKREIAFRLSTLRRLKDKTGKSFLNGEALDAGLTEDLLAMMIAEALVEKNLTEDQIADLISIPDVPRVIEEVMIAYAGSLPKKDSEEDTKKN